MSGKRRRALAAAFKATTGRPANRRQSQLMKRGFRQGAPVAELPIFALLTDIAQSQYEAVQRS